MDSNSNTVGLRTISRRLHAEKQAQVEARKPATRIPAMHRIASAPKREAITADERPRSEGIYGLCCACGCFEVRLNNQTGARDYSGIGESANYPIGYGCELCD